MTKRIDYEMAREFSRSVADVDPNKVFTTLL